MKKLKVFFKIILRVIVSVILLVAILGVSGTFFNRNLKPDSYLSNWMAEISDEAKIMKIAIPGSHDSGTYGMVWLGETQGYSIEEQLSFGARYFDIRVNKTASGYQMYHGDLNGKDFVEALKSIKTFIQEHPSETILLDFQHFRGNSKVDVYNMLEEELVNDGLAVINEGENDDLTFIRELKLNETRGKCIIFFGETNEDPSNWVFLRNNDDCTKNNMCLDSYYVTEYHTKGFKQLTTIGHNTYLQLLADKKNNNENGIFVLQCQLTDGLLVFGPWSLERGCQKKMSEYINELAEIVLDYDLNIDDINVVLRDFLTPSKCEEIINLNAYKSFSH